MSETQVFTVEVEVWEQPDHTEAKAMIEIGGEVRGGWGRARRNPDDPDRPIVGEELAIARALGDLARHLGGDVEAQIATIEGKPVHVHL
ncbi:MAG TPA: dsRBD fold-containing protein [Acidimicrobiales bacterium]|nr:dsRBD fold-containing protein [Acidimicrobiales bacterium]